MTSGRRRAEKAAGTSQGRRTLLDALGVLVAGAAWVLLVSAAIDFGRTARFDGSATGWLFTVAAGLGAALCLLLVFVLLARLRATLRSRPRREPGRHR